MTNREAIEILKENNKLTKEALDYEITMTDKMENEIRQYTEALDLAIQALEKQEPKKVKHEISNLNDLEYVITRCPQCGKGIGGFLSNNCDNCGQVIVWEE